MRWHSREWWFMVLAAVSTVLSGIRFLVLALWPS